ncbi:MAG: gliding motility-associated C-terminal domain-containing protein [Flavobacteriales bacterium]|nr:gliding motility-associated C-terminal domain-containing protein [Flavobacteriales bacterium]
MNFKLISQIKFILIGCFLFVFPFIASSQVDVTMSTAVNGQTFYTCGGTLYASGGVSGAGYSNGENVTVIICPDTPGDVITLDFITFNLSTQNTATPPSNNADNMSIYDGNSVAAPTLGTYGGTQLQGLLVTCTSFNTSGCITIVFNSNSAGTGNFAASITCSTPCQRPVAVLSAPTVDSMRICEGDAITFNGSPSYAASGFNIAQYEWNFDDGVIDTTSGPVVSHTFTTEGEYLVDLFLTDDNGCAATNRVTVQVLVGTTPNFVGTSPNATICLGETYCLNGIVNAVTYTGLPHNNLGGATYLPDDVGQCFESTIDFNVFAPGQSLTNINDLLSICVNMEHSYIGDLVASIYCPDGTQVVLYQQGGGWNSLGEPVDITGPNDPPGVGYDYCWSPNATLGTWAQCGNAGATPNLVTTPNGVPTLAPGTYSSLNPLSDLVGCPLNGTWTLEFCDLWGADDGWVFDWSINFNPALFPDITEFTPVYGPNCDSTFWTADNGASQAIISSTSPDCNQICLAPQSVGTYSYTYHAIDDFGCSYDTTITLTVTQPPIPDAGNNLVACPNVPIQLNGAVPNSGSACDWTFHFHDSFGDGWNGASMNVIINGSTTNYTLGSGSDVDYIINMPAGATIQIDYTPGFWESEVSYTITDCNGNLILANGPNPPTGTVYTGMNGLDMVFQWTPTTGLSNPNIANPTATVNAPTWYYLSTYENGHPLCAVTDSVFIDINPAVFAGLDGTNTICYNDPQFDMFTFLGGNPVNTGSWFDPSGNATTNMFDPAVFTNGGVFTYVVPANLGCPADSATVTVTVLQPTDPLCCQVAFTVASTNITCNGICDGTITISSQQAGTEFSFDNGVTFTFDSTATGLCAGQYNLAVRFGGCINVQQITLTQPTALTATIGSITDVSCNGFSDGSLTVTANGGTAPYSYLWNDACAQTTSVCGNNCVPAGNYCVTVTDANGCTISVCDDVIEPTAMVLNFLVVDVSCFGLCDGNATVIPNGGTTPYSYNWNGIPGTTSSTTQATDLCAGNYNLTVTDAHGCIADTLGWNVAQPAQVTITSVTFTDEICYGACDGTITIVAPNATQFSINNGASFQNNGNFVGNCVGTYPILVQDANGCQTTSSVTVSGPPPVVSLFQASPQPTTTFNSTIQFVNLSSGAIAYAWDFASLGTSILSDPSFIFPDDSAGVYNVCLMAVNANACADTFCLDIIINEEFVLYAPNAFTPDGNGRNEIFRVYGNDIDPEDFTLLIYDRWGELVFTSNSLNAGWDGTFKGQKVKNDVYVWKVKTRSLHTGKRYEKIGHVTLVR